MMTDEQLLEYRRVKLLERDKQLCKLIAVNIKLREDLREDLREEGLRDQITWLQTANDRQEADLSMAKTALAETMKLFNNQPNAGLRDHFAGLAMQALMNATPKYCIMLIAIDAYKMADGMLAERGKNMITNLEEMKQRQ